MLVKAPRYYSLITIIRSGACARYYLCLQLIHDLAKEKLPDIAYSFQETMFSMLCEATERALFLLGKKELILCGGVAQNKRLNEMLQSIADSHGVKFGVAPDQFNADNGAMIAVVGLEMLENKDHYTLSEATIDQKFRADKFEIKWQL